MFGVYFVQAVLYFGVSGIFVRLINSGYSFLGYQTFAATTTAALLVFPPFRLGEFVIGMCIGLLILQRESFLGSPRRANLLLGFSIVALVLIMRFLGLSPSVASTQAYLLFVPFLALILLALVSGQTLVTPVLDNPLAILLGEASYSLYLVHAFFMPGPHPGQLKYIMCVVGSIVSSVILYAFLEQPARRIWRRLLGSGRALNVKSVVHSEYKPSVCPGPLYRT